MSVTQLYNTYAGKILRSFVRYEELAFGLPKEDSYRSRDDDVPGYHDEGYGEERYDEERYDEERYDEERYGNEDYDDEAYSGGYPESVVEYPFTKEKIRRFLSGNVTITTSDGKKITIDAQEYYSIVKLVFSKLTASAREELETYLPLLNPVTRSYLALRGNAIDNETLLELWEKYPGFFNENELPCDVMESYILQNLKYIPSHCLELYVKNNLFTWKFYQEVGRSELITKNHQRLCVERFFEKLPVNDYSMVLENLIQPWILNSIDLLINKAEIYNKIPYEDLQGLLLVHPYLIFIYCRFPETFDLNVYRQAKEEIEFHSAIFTDILIKLGYRPFTLTRDTKLLAPLVDCFAVAALKNNDFTRLHIDGILEKLISNNIYGTIQPDGSGKIPIQPFLHAGLDDEFYDRYLNIIAKNSSMIQGMSLGVEPPRLIGLPVNSFNPLYLSTRYLDMTFDEVVYYVNLMKEVMKIKKNDDLKSVIGELLVNIIVNNGNRYISLRDEDFREFCSDNISYIFTIDTISAEEIELLKYGKVLSYLPPAAVSDYFNNNLDLFLRQSTYNNNKYSNPLVSAFLENESFEHKQALENYVKYGDGRRVKMVSDILAQLKNYPDDVLEFTGSIITKASSEDQRSFINIDNPHIPLEIFYIIANGRYREYIWGNINLVERMLTPLNSRQAKELLIKVPPPTGRRDIFWKFTNCSCLRNKFNIVEWKELINKVPLYLLLYPIDEKFNADFYYWNMYNYTANPSVMNDIISSVGDYRKIRRDVEEVFEAVLHLRALNLHCYTRAGTKPLTAEKIPEEMLSDYENIIEQIADYQDPWLETKGSKIYPELEVLKKVADYITGIQEIKVPILYYGLPAEFTTTLIDLIALNPEMEKPLAQTIDGKTLANIFPYLSEEAQLIVCERTGRFDLPDVDALLRILPEENLLPLVAIRNELSLISKGDEMCADITDKIAAIYEGVTEDVSDTIMFQALSGLSQSLLDRSSEKLPARPRSLLYF